MSAIKEINEMFRQERYEEAFALATSEWQNDPENVWEQRKMGWAYIYMMKYAENQADWTTWKQHFQSFFSLNQLSYDNDVMIFDKLLWSIRSVPFSEDIYALIFNFIRTISFNPSNGYSALLNRVLKCKDWPHLMEFIEWWDLSKLQPADYLPYEFTDEKGRTKKSMCLAEQAHITYAKLLLVEHNLHKIGNFIPKLEWLNDNYPQFVYPGYFCGKLLLALDADDNQTLGRLIPFVRRKSREFWAWRLLSEVFDEDLDKQIACLYRAISCCQKEDFIGKVRLQLAQILLKRKDFARAKAHLDVVLQTYQRHTDWSFPRALWEYSQQDWFKNTVPDQSSPIDYMKISNDIVGLKNSQHKTTQQQNQKRQIEGKVTANKSKTALFLSNNDVYAFIPQSLAEKVKEGDRAKATVVDALDKKRNTMGLRCISIETYFNNPSATLVMQSIPVCEATQNYEYIYEPDDDLPF